MISVAKPEKASMIPVAKPWIGEAEAEAVRRPLLSGWVTQGPEVAAFEQEFANFVGAPHACAVANCTVALHLALRAVGVREGDEVITVSHSFIASANSVRYCGAIPVFVDIDPNTYTMDPALVERVITPRTRAILCVHQIGMPCDMAALGPIAERHNLPIVEDAACAVGSELRRDGVWERIGKPHSTVACFSFHPRKLLTTGDGGMLTTADPALDQRFRLWRQHSMDISDTVRHSTNTVVFESYRDLGYNYRLTDIQAAVGREQLKRLPQVITQRRRQVERYRTLLADIPGLILPVEPDWARSNWQSFCVRLPTGRQQAEVMQRMLDAGIATRRGIMCAHREPAYAVEPWTCGSDDCPSTSASGHCTCLYESEQAQDHTILLPLFHELSDAQQDSVAAALREACAS